MINKTLIITLSTLERHHPHAAESITQADMWSAKPGAAMESTIQTIEELAKVNLRRYQLFLRMRTILIIRVQ